MKNPIWFILTISLLFQFKLIAQTIDHPTINSLDVSYTMALGTEFLAQDEVKYSPILKIKFRSEVLVKKIYLKIIKDSSEDAVLDETYTLNFLPVFNQDGIKVFFKDNEEYFFHLPIQIPLELYKYQLITEDPNGIKSVTFTEIH